MIGHSHGLNWDMRLYGDCKGWWDISDSDSVTLDTGEITTITDKSSHGKNLTTASAPDRPTLHSGDQNGLDTAGFDGSANFLTAGTTGDWTFLHNGNINYVFGVVKWGESSDPGNNRQLLGTNTGSTNIGSRITFIDAPSDDERVARVTSNGSAHCVINNGGDNSAVVNDYAIYSFYGDPSNGTAADRSILRVDTTEYTNNAQTGTPTSSNSEIALHIGTDTSNYFEGRIGELVLYDGTLYAGYTQAFVEALLNYKWQCF